MENCYVCQVKNGIIARRELAQQGYAIWMPLVKELTRGKGIVMRPMFPGYLFVFFDPELERWRSINGTRGVRKLLMVNEDRPALVRREWVDGMMKDAEKWIGEKEVEIGQQLEILEGPLAGMQGKCVAAGKQRVQLLLYLLGSETRVSLEKGQVAPLR